MLALTDQQLAHLAISATKIPRRDRRQWLAETAARIEEAAAAEGKSTLARARLKQAAYRERRNGHRCVLRIEVDEIALAQALIALGELPPDAEDDRARIEAVLGEQIRNWVGAWSDRA